jgi:hypothetical protein
MDDASDERFQHHEEILRSLAAILVKQDLINDHHDVFLAEQIAINLAIPHSLLRGYRSKGRV